jgi:hypothetical protein
MNNLLIAGGGKFSIKAIKYAKFNNFKTILIDTNSECLASKFIDSKFTDLNKLITHFKTHQQQEIIFLQGDISIINKLINRINFLWIIPVVPIHLMALIDENIFKSKSINLTPDTKTCKVISKKIKKDLLLPSPIQKGILYLSYAKENEICPNNCIGSPDYCSHFKREKPITITNYLKKIFEISENFTLKREAKNIIISLHSYQLIPGLGGLKGKDVYSISNKVKENSREFKKSQHHLIVATSCNCHGVINFYATK